MNKIENKIYMLGLSTLDELLLHRNISKKVEVGIEDSRALSDMIVHVGAHAIFSFDEKEIDDFYRLWALYKMKRLRSNCEVTI
ncbi:MAG: hypothetical protein U9N61_00040 [Euryarchaeota archaeon]|nr:hypothetical protein [Euryarchaeota archaeon]